MVVQDVEQLEGRVRGSFLSSTERSKTGVLVLGGSSGRVDTVRARLFANAGAHALALQWFGGTNSLAVKDSHCLSPPPTARHFEVLGCLPD